MQKQAFKLEFIFRGRMTPYTSKAPVARGTPLVCTHTAEGHHKPVLCVQATDQLLFTGSKGKKSFRIER